MFTNNNGSGPGAVTPKNDVGLVTGQSDKPQKTNSYSTDFTSTIIAAYARMKATMSGFYLDRGIGADTLLMIALALIYGFARVTA